MENRTQIKTGRIIAFGLILMFAGLVSWKKNDRSEAFPENNSQSQPHLTKNTRNQIQAQTKKLENLRYAYTGKWEKNDLSKNNAGGTFEFKPAKNTRNNIQATAAKNVKKAKKSTKKKVAKKAKRPLYKNANKKRSLNNRDLSNNRGNTYAGYYNANNNVQERNPSDQEQKDQLSAQQWFDLIIAAGSGDDFIKAFSSGAVSRGTLYTVSEMLLSSDNEDYKKIGFSVLASLPSALSIVKYAAHINSEMSAELKAYAQSTLSVYNSPSQLRTLNSLLSANDSAVKIIVANLIHSITSTILQTHSAEGSSVVYTPAQIEEYKSMLAQSLNVINNILSAGVDGDVQASFLAARTVLVQFLG